MGFGKPRHEFHMDVHSDEMTSRSKAMLVGLSRTRSLKVLRCEVSGRNGYEVYRQFLKLFKPSTKLRSMALLSALMSLPAFSKDKSLYDPIQRLDRLIAECQKASGLTAPDEVRFFLVSLSVFIKCLPANIRQQIQLSLDQFATYVTVQRRVFGFESVTNNSALSHIHSEFGIIGVSSTTHDTGGPMPMDVNRVESKGKSKSESKPKGKSKSDSSNSKGRGKVKGKLSSPTGKGKGTPSSQVDKSNVCLYCGRSGRWKRDCRKFKSDQETGQVRQVEGGTFQQVPPPPQPASQGLPV